MAITVTQFPTYPIAGRQTRLQFACTAGGNYIKVFLTAAPRASTHHATLERLESSGVLIHEGPDSVEWLFTADAPGVYAVNLQEIRRSASDFGGSFEGDTRGYTSQELLSTTSTSVTTGTRMTMPVGSGVDIGTLVLYMFGTTCRGTTEDEHGEVTPAIVECRTPRIETAARSANVVAALTALRNRDPAALMSSVPATVFGNIAATFALHRASAVFHDNADTDNVVDSSYYFPENPKRLAESVGRLLQAFRRHQQNDDGTGVGNGAYHQSGGGTTNASDYDHATTVDVPGSQEEAIRALADLWWAYEAHRADGIHAAADGANTLTALGPVSIWQVHRYVLSELASVAPTAHATDNAGAVTLSAGFGMKAEDE
jgi:hypothetical protein